jgi:hypothetical protein
MARSNRPYNCQCHLPRELGQLTDPGPVRAGMENEAPFLSEALQKRRLILTSNKLRLHATIIPVTDIDVSDDNVSDARCLCRCP